MSETTKPPQRMERRAGVLVPLFSLRSRQSWGCGDAGDLVPFARWAGQAGFSLVQLLPVNATSGADASPYAATSAFAIDPVYLSLDACEDFIAAGGRQALPQPLHRELDQLADEPAVSWPRVRALKAAAAHLSFQRFLRDEWEQKTPRAHALMAFRERHAAWLDDYALFATLHERLKKSWLDWPAELKNRVPEALAGARAEHATQLLERTWMQWQLDDQWRRVRAEVASQGVSLMGDLPFVVSTDSADVWSHPEAFRIDLTVGTPPDMFSPTGQDWGLPAYDWEALGRDDFAWMRARAARAGELYSAFRVDHVIGLYRTFVRRSKDDAGHFWPVEEPAQIALGEKVLDILEDAGEVIAEDLGAVPHFLPGSLERLGVPGYRVLRWEQDWHKQEALQKEAEARAALDRQALAQQPEAQPQAPVPDEPVAPVEVIFRLPSSWPIASLATNGTHDTDSSAEWYESLRPHERAGLARLPGLEVAAAHERFDPPVRDALLGVLYAAPSELVLVPFQDLFGHRERVNVPGTVNDTNWTYRLPMPVEQLAADRASIDRLHTLAVATKRR